MRVMYLHGFASGPHSRKATFFRERLEENGVSLSIPDLAGGDFRNLTLTSQLKLIEQQVGGENVFFIGSSMGGYLASLYASSHSEVSGLILLAPAFNFYARWAALLGPEKMAEWRDRGEISTYHYGECRDLALSFRLMEDAKAYEPFPGFVQPCLIFHGVTDTTVPIVYSEGFVREHTNARLIRLQSGHEMTDVLDNVWTEAAPNLFKALGR